MGQPVSPSVEMDRILNQLDVYETMIEVGVDTPEIRYALTVEADAFINLIVKNSDYYLRLDSMDIWFGLDKAEESKSLMIAKEFAAMTMLHSVKEVDGIEALKSVGFIDFLEDLYPEKSRSELRQWILKQAHLWVRGLQQMVSSEDRLIREKGLRYAYQNSGDSTFLKMFAKKVLDPLSESEKLRLAQDFLDHPEERVRNVLLPWALEAIPRSLWTGSHSYLFSQILLRAGQSRRASEGVILWLSKKPRMALSKIPLVQVLTDQLKYYQFGKESLTLIEQLNLISPHYRDFSYIHLLKNKNRAWAIELIQFAFENELPTSKELGRALATSATARDPRWFEWVNNLTFGARYPWVRQLVIIEKLFTSTSDLAFEVQKKIFADAQKRIEWADPIPMVKFIEGASVNPRLVELMVNFWGAQIITYGKTSITRAFVSHIFFHRNIDLGTRMYWLELLLMKGLNDPVSLELLIRVFGYHPNFLEDMARSHDNEKMRVEVMRASLMETLLTDSQKLPVVTCKQIFAL